MKRLLLLILAASIGLSAEARHPIPAWLRDAVVYHIYPSTYMDSDGDGIGDIEGIRSKLDYIRSVGFNTVWISPVFESEFEDGGYDITDFYRVDPRFGDNAALERLIADAHTRGLRVCLDLVAGHTSDKHPWFVASSSAERNEYSDYFIWTPGKQGGKPDKKFVDNDLPRDGYYMKNFYDIQPALNYGYTNPDPSKPWQQGYDDPGPTAVREELKNIISFWMDKGADGFRVDMAGSLVKGDDKAHTGIRRLWSDLFDWFEAKYPEGILMSEWSQPQYSLDAGFDIDLIIHNGRGNKLYRTLFTQTANNGDPTPCYFDPEGRGGCRTFVDDYTAMLRETAHTEGIAAMPTCSHDIWRLNRFDRSTPAELKTMLTFFFTMPWTPIVYYGEEIGMRNIEDAPVKEGSFSSRNRSSCRTPMQWDSTPNAGFSTAAPELLYLPIDPSPARPTVAAQIDDPASVLSYVKQLIALHKSTPALGTGGTWQFLSDPDRPYPMVYLRQKDGERYIVALNPTRRSVSASFFLSASSAEEILTTCPGNKYTLAKGSVNRIRLKPCSAVIYKIR